MVDLRVASSFTSRAPLEKLSMRSWVLSNLADLEIADRQQSADRKLQIAKTSTCKQPSMLYVMLRVMAFDMYAFAVTVM